jgi:benzil reductase ((S)-benzoin forming)
MTHRHTIIVTGASRGIGQAIVERLAGPGKFIICVSREPSVACEKQARALQAGYFWHPLDLSDLDQVQAALPALFDTSLLNGSERVWLINNAGAINPVKRLGGIDPADLRRNIALNLTAPMMLTNAFVEATKTLECPRLEVNISSGAAKRPIDGWSAYCSAKAGLDMATRALALEQAGAKNPVRVLSFAPGIVDTRMQEELRIAAPEDFALRDQFIAFKNEGKLASAEAVADLLVRYLEQDAFDNGALVDFRELSSK